MRRLAVFAVAIALGSRAGQAEHILPSPSFEAGSGIEMRIINCYEDIPPAGFLPVRVEVKNHSHAPRTWQFQAVHSQSSLRSMQFVASLAVDAGSERTFELLMPIAPPFAVSSRYSNLLITVTGYGVAGGTTSEHSSGSGLTPTPFLGMGEALSVKNWGPLRERMEKKHSRSLDGSSIDPHLLPEDWRGLAGFEIMVFSDTEWRQIPASQRNAIQDWIIQGGKLVLCRAGTTETPDLPNAGDLGTGAVLHWTPGENFLDQVSHLLMATEVPAITAILQNYTWQWPLAQSVGRPEPPRLLIISFVVGFALVIGPLNFLAFAPLGQRHRLFWTTPAIALAASALMGLFIVLSEGFGGRGERFEVLLNLPQLRKSVVWQEQASRTGVLASSAFVPSEPSLILPIGLRDSPGRYPLSEHGKTYLLDGTMWSGDWFRSRTTQAQLLSAVLPTRAQVQIVNSQDAAPSAVSTFDQEMTEFWYFDEEGIAWKAENLRPGERQVLKRTEQHAFEAWWRAALKPAGPITRGHAEAYLKDRGGKFFASTKAPRFITSLATIRWKDSSGLILGQASR
jgi:hypothetical protein